MKELGVCYPIFPAVLKKNKNFLLPRGFQFLRPLAFSSPTRSLTYSLSVSLTVFFFLIYQLTIYVLGPEQQLNYSFYDRFAGLSSSPGRIYKYIYIYAFVHVITRVQCMCVCVYTQHPVLPLHDTGSPPPGHALALFF